MTPILAAFWHRTRREFVPMTAEDLSIKTKRHHDLIVYRAETEDRKFRLTTLSRQALEAGPFIPTPDPLASEVMFSFLVQQMGAAAMASMLNENQLAKMWQREDQ